MLHRRGILLALFSLLIFIFIWLRSSTSSFDVVYIAAPISTSRSTQQQRLMMEDTKIDAATATKVPVGEAVDVGAHSIQVDIDGSTSSHVVSGEDEGDGSTITSTSGAAVVESDNDKNNEKEDTLAAKDSTRSKKSTRVVSSSPSLVTEQQQQTPRKNNVTEIVIEDPIVDGVWYPNNQSFSQLNGIVLPESEPQSRFISTVKWMGKCWYEVTNFCVLNGQLTLFHEPVESGDGPRQHSLRMCNEFTQHSPLVRLKYISEPAPLVSELPAPLLTKTRGWVLQFWCQDLFHMTLTLLPAFHTRFALGDHPDVYVRIARGKRKKSAYCRVKLGDPTDFFKVRNEKWGGDTQFPFAGNPFWPFYQVVTPDPHRILPLYRGATKKKVCYKKGIVDKMYVKDIIGQQAFNYSETIREKLGVPKHRKRKCGKYRFTMMDRKGRTRRLTNVPAIVDLARSLGFEDVKSVFLETLPIREQLRLITETDLMMGMHGNGQIWLQFLQSGSVVVELIGVWYRPYAELWGHKHFHSSMKNNMDFKRGGEYKAFAHNLTEIEELLKEGKKELDRTSCDVENYVPPNRKNKLENLYASCVPHC